MPQLSNQQNKMIFIYSKFGYYLRNNFLRFTKTLASLHVELVLVHLNHTQYDTRNHYHYNSELYSALDVSLLTSFIKCTRQVGVPIYTFDCPLPYIGYIASFTLLCIDYENDTQTLQYSCASPPNTLYKELGQSHQDLQWCMAQYLSQYKYLN